MKWRRPVNAEKVLPENLLEKVRKHHTGILWVPTPGRAQKIGDWEAAEKLDRMIRCHLKDLKAAKIARERDTSRGPETTPAKRATALPEKLVESRNKPGRKSTQKRKQEHA